MTNPYEGGLVAWACSRLARKTDAELREVLRVLQCLETAEVALLDGDTEDVPEMLANTRLHLARVRAEAEARGLVIRSRHDADDR